MHCLGIGQKISTYIKGRTPVYRAVKQLFWSLANLLVKQFIVVTAQFENMSNKLASFNPHFDVTVLQQSSDGGQ